MSFTDSVQQERTRLHTERQRLQGEKQKLDSEIAGIAKQLAALDAYDKAIGGASVPPAASGRRAGIRDQVLDAVKAGHNSAAAIRTALNLTGKSASQSVSNALSALKKDSKITADDSGAYRIAG